DLQALAVAVPKFNIQGGAGAYLSDGWTTLNLAVIVNGTSGVNGYPSVLVFKDDLTGNVNMLNGDKDSINITDGAAVYFYGGDAFGFKGGIGGDIIPIFISGVHSNLVDLSAGGTTVSLKAYIEVTDGSVGVYKNDTLIVVSARGVRGAGSA